MGVSDARVVAGGDDSAVALRSLARGGALNLAAAVVSSLANVLLVFLVARGFSLRDAGIFFAATSVFLLAVRISELGTGTGLVYFLSRFRALGRPDRMGATLRIAVIPVLGAAAVAGVAVFVSAPWLAQLLVSGDTGEVATYLRILALFLPLAVIGDTCLAATRGYGTMRPSALIDKILRPITQALFTVVAIALGSTLGLTLAWVTPYLAAAMASSWWLRRLRGRSGAPNLGIGDRFAGEFWRFTAPRSVAGLAQIALQRLDVVLVAALRGPEEAAIYTAATRFLVVGQLAGQAISQAVQPKLAGLLAREDRASTKKLYQTATCWLVLVVWPFYLAFVLLAPVVLQLFGPRYADGAGVVVLLTGAMLIATGCGMVDTVLNMAGRTTWNLGNALLALAVNIAVDLVLIPPLGILGAAIGWAAAILVNNLLPLGQIWISLGLHPFGGGTLTAMGLSAICFGLVPLIAAWTIDGGAITVAAALGAGLLLFLAGCYRWRAILDLHAMRALRRPRPSPPVLPNGTPPRVTERRR